MMIAAGTGIGGAVIAHGRLVRGNHGFAGEIGHIACSQAVGIPCVCGGAGHLELVASGSGIEARYAEITGNHIDGAEISRRAAEGEPAAHKVIMTAGIALGEAIAGITNLLDPDMVVIGGSVPKAAPSGVRRCRRASSVRSRWRSAVCLSLRPSWAGTPRLSARQRICLTTWRMSRLSRSSTSLTTSRRSKRLTSCITPRSTWIWKIRGSSSLGKSQRPKPWIRGYGRRLF